MGQSERNPISVLVADRSPIFRQGLVDVLGRYENILVIGEVSTPEEAIRVCMEQCPDLILLESKLGGLDLMHEFNQSGVDSKIILLSEVEEDDAVIEGVMAGARGYFVKTANPNELLQCITKVQSGELWVRRRIIDALLERLLELTDGQNETNDSTMKALHSLSRRKLEILKLAAAGLSNKEIAVKLSISEKTVKAHLYNIFKEIGVHKRRELLPLAATLAK